MEQIFENQDKTIQTFVNEEHSYIYIQISGDVNDEDYQISNTKGLEKLIELGICRILMNQESMGKVSNKSRAWLLTQHLPKVRQEFGNKLQIAIVQPEGISQKIGQQVLLKSLIKHLGNFNIKQFDSKEKAHEWLTK